jgi:hypothetical protein
MKAWLKKIIMSIIGKLVDKWLGIKKNDEKKNDQGGVGQTSGGSEGSGPGGTPDPPIPIDRNY